MASHKIWPAFGQVPDRSHRRLDGQRRAKTMTYILAIDQGTTSSRAIVFDAKMQPIASAQQEFTQYFPASGWVEHDVEEIWDSVLKTCAEALAKSGITAADLVGIEITNQRETTVIWDAKTGKAIHKAIVWQDRRTAPFCEELRAAGHTETIMKTTGLLPDPYFSGTKVKWLLDQQDDARAQAAAGTLLFGTMDKFLDLAADKRCVPRHRRHQCCPYNDVRHPRW